MTTVQQIYEEMQRIAPLALAESWDNPGLLVDCGGEVSRVLVTLDITPEVVEEAARKGCGLIVSHHPVIFSPLKKLSGQDVAFRLVKKLGLPGLAVNLDVGTMIANGEHPEDFALDMKYVSHIHISEPGLGAIQPRPIHRQLALLLGAVGYRGFVSVEMKAQDPDTLTACLEYVKEVFGEV